MRRRTIHDWHGIYEVCQRCGITQLQYQHTNQPDCLTDAELADRAAWRKEADIAAELMRRERR